MLIKLGTLHQIFKGRPNTGLTVCDTVCVDCCMRIRVTVARTTAGYGLQGGVLYEPRPAEIRAKCPDCYRVATLDIDGACDWSVIEGEDRATRLRRSGLTQRLTRITGSPNPPNTESTEY